MPGEAAAAGSVAGGLKLSRVERQEQLSILEVGFFSRWCDLPEKNRGGGDTRETENAEGKGCVHT